MEAIDQGFDLVGNPLVVRWPASQRVADVVGQAQGEDIRSGPPCMCPSHPSQQILVSSASADRLASTNQVGQGEAARPGIPGEGQQIHEMLASHGRNQIGCLHQRIGQSPAAVGADVDRPPTQHVDHLLRWCGPLAAEPRRCELHGVAEANRPGAQEGPRRRGAALVSRAHEQDPNGSTLWRVGPSNASPPGDQRHSSRRSTLPQMHGARAATGVGHAILRRDDPLTGGAGEQAGRGPCRAAQR